MAVLPQDTTDSPLAWGDLAASLDEGEAFDALVDPPGAASRDCGNGLLDATAL
jgi:hypothetical protein